MMYYRDFGKRQAKEKTPCGNRGMIKRKTGHLPFLAVRRGALLLFIAGVLVSCGSKDAVPAEQPQETTFLKEASTETTPHVTVQESTIITQEEISVPETAQTAATKEISPHWVSGSGNPAKPVVLYDLLSDAEKKLYDAMEEHYSNGTREVKLGKQDGSKIDMFERVEYAFMNDHPYVGMIHYYTSSNRLPVTAGSDEFRIIFEDRRDYAADYKAIRAEADPFVKELHGTASEKVLQINDYITDRVYYDYAYFEDYQNQIDANGWRVVDPANMPVELTHSAYAAIVERVAVCDGYALAFAAMCQEAEIPCYILMGDAGTDTGEYRKHAWNIVQLEDGNWYEIDTTWNDSRGDHTYFCLPSSEMERNHTRKDADMYGFANIIPRTDENSSGETASVMNGSARPDFADFYWVEDLKDKDKSPLQNAERLTDADRISGDWKVMLMDIPSDDPIFNWRMLLNINISICGNEAKMAADWYRNYTLVPGTLQQFSVYDATGDSSVTYTGSFSPVPEEKTLTVRDTENAPENKYLFNGGGYIDTIRVDRFVEKNGKQYGVGSVFGNEGEEVARITLVR